MTGHAPTCFRVLTAGREACDCGAGKPCTSLTSFSCSRCGECVCPPDPPEWTELFLKEELTRPETKRFLELGYEIDAKIKASGCPLHNGASRHALLMAEGL